MASFYTLEEAARVLGMSPEELKHKAQAREVRAFLDGGTWRFRQADVDELARRRGMGSDPDLSLSDLDLDVPPVAGSGSDDINLSEFQLGVASPDVAPRSLFDMQASDDDILLDDMAVPPQASGSSSTIIGMKPTGKLPSDSDVRLVPDLPKGASDSDVRMVAPPPAAKLPSDSDVTLVAGPSGVHPAAARLDDPGATTLRPSPLLGASGELETSKAPSQQDSDSDFELTPSSVIDALQPESGSDFELTALDQSDEFEATPRPRGPADSDVTGAGASSSGVNLGRPSDSGINLLGGGFDMKGSDSIELAPLDDEEPTRPAPTAKAAQPRPPAKEKVDLSATALPMKAEKDIFEDTDFEVNVVGSDEHDQTVQLEQASDFDLDESESASEVFALDEDDVDQNAATAMAPGLPADDFEESASGEEAISGETAASGWDDLEAEPSPSTSTSRASAVSSPSLAPAGPGPEWGGLWVGMLIVATVFMLLLTFVGMDLVRNLYEYRGDGPASGLVRSLAGLMGG